MENLNPFTPLETSSNTRQAELDLQADFARASSTTAKGFLV